MSEDGGVERDYKDDCGSVALICAIVGIVLTGGAFLWPLESDYVIDPDLSAVENEKRQLWNYHKATIILLLMVVGIGLVAVAGLITTAIFYKMIMTDDCLNTPPGSHSCSYNDLSRSGHQQFRTPSAPPMFPQTRGADYQPNVSGGNNCNISSNTVATDSVYSTPKTSALRSYGALHNPD